MMVCATCYRRWPRCRVCGMPLQKDASTELGDGRWLCNEDYNQGVFNQKDLEDVFRQTRRELERTFYRFSMIFPTTNVTTTLADANLIESVTRKLSRHKQAFSETQ